MKEEEKEGEDEEDDGRAVEGGEVMVKPPAMEMEGMWTSSHWPGRWQKGGYWVE